MREEGNRCVRLPMGKAALKCHISSRSLEEPHADKDEGRAARYEPECGGFVAT